MIVEAVPSRLPDVVVAAPATSANLGPGFDCLALALDLWNTIEIWYSEIAGIRVAAVAGEGCDTLERDEDNLAIVAMRRLAEQSGLSLPHCELRLRNAVPVGRGLGSSAAAIAGGLVAAAAMLGLPADTDFLIETALSLEDHPDNVVAALLGGFTVGILDAGKPRVLRVTPPTELRAVLLIPEGFSSTLESRQTLPPTVSRSDATFNGGRCALLAMALSQGRWDLLGVAMQDRLHQPHRALGFLHLEEAIAEALAAGAHGAALSGAGSSVIALTTGKEDAVAAALAAVAARRGQRARTLILAPALRGAHQVEPPPG